MDLTTLRQLQIQCVTMPEHFGVDAHAKNIIIKARQSMCVQKHLHVDDAMRPRRGGAERERESARQTQTHTDRDKDRERQREQRMRVFWLLYGDWSY